MKTELQKRLDEINDLVQRREAIDLQLMQLMGVSDDEAAPKRKRRYKKRKQAGALESESAPDPEPERQPVIQEFPKSSSGHAYRELSEDEKNTVFLMADKAMPNLEIAQQLRTSLIHISQLIRRHEGKGNKSPKVKDWKDLRTPGGRNEYQCDNRHVFKSNLAPGEAMCPECRSTKVHVFVPEPVTEDDLYGIGSNFGHAAKPRN